MRTIRQVNIKSRQNYFFNDVNNISDFDPSLLNVDSIEFKSNNGMMLRDYTELWNEIKEHIELISGNKVIKYSRDFMKIKFKSDDDLPLGKIINVPVCVIIAKGVFEEDSKYYSQVLLHEYFYEYEENIDTPVV